MGKRRLKGLVELGELLGREYGKTSDGPRLFGALDVGTARARPHGSRSFDLFLRSILV